MANVAKSFAQLISQSKDKKAGPYDTQATVKRVEGNTVWVSIPGGVDETPINKTINCTAGDTVQVRVSGGRAWITGNASAPPTDDKAANEAKGVAVIAQTTAVDAKETADAVEGIAVEANETATQAENKADTALSQAGQSITTDTLHYLATSQGSGVTINTQGWTTTIQTITKTDKYLWIYHTYHKASGQSINTNPVIAGVYGETGATGAQGPTGSTGAQGVSVSAVQPQYYLSTSSSSATGGSWANTITYEAGKYIWCRDQITYSDTTTGYSTAVYNEALTTACATADNALNIAEGIDEHFWHDNTGAHVTQVTQDEWNDSTDPNYHSGGNTLITSTGMAIRDGMTELASFGGAATIGEVANGKSRLHLSGGNLQILYRANGSDNVVGEFSSTRGLVLDGHDSGIGTEKYGEEALTNLSNNSQTNGTAKTQLELGMGVWIITAWAQFDTNSTGRRWLAIRDLTYNETDQEVNQMAVSGAPTRMTTTFIASVGTDGINYSTTYCPRVYQNSGSGLLTDLKISAVRIA